MEVIDNDGDGAALTGMETGNAIYEARDNVGGPATDWALLATSPLTAPAGGSASDTFRQPAAGRQVITASVSEIQSAVGFTLTGLDSANGMANFSVVPPPSSISATAGTPQSTTVGTAFGTELQATVLDDASDPVPDVVVAFTAPGAGASATFPSGTTATTNAAGQASVPIIANPIEGSYQSPPTSPRLSRRRRSSTSPTPRVRCRRSPPSAPGVCSHSCSSWPDRAWLS